MQWSDDGGDQDGGGHLYCSNFSYDSIISFTSPTYVNNFQMNGMPNASQDPSAYNFSGPMQIAAFDLAGSKLWNATIDFAVVTPPENVEYTGWGNWLTVDVSTAQVSNIIFYGPNPVDLVNYPDTAIDPYGPDFTPSIDNLVINEAPAAPIPASVWLLGSGLLGLVGLRRKFTR